MGDCVRVHPAEESGYRPWFTCLSVFSLYLAATWPQTHIRARGKGLTHTYESGRPDSKSWKYQNAQENHTELRGSGSSDVCRHW